jgi:hypothetical protein
MVLNPNGMISTIAPMTKTSVQVPKSQGANEKLDPYHGET